MGSGVSGGEEGARYGPSLMPGGNAAAWPFIKEIFQVRFSHFQTSTIYEYDKFRSPYHSTITILEYMCAV